MLLQILDNILLIVEDGQCRVKIHCLPHLEGGPLSFLINDVSFSSTRHLSHPIKGRSKNEGSSCVFGGKEKDLEKLEG